MTHDLDDLIRSLPAASGPTPLSGLEDEVWRRVGAQRLRRASARAQASALALAAVIGAAGGGVIAQRAAAPSELQVLTVEAALDPFHVTSDFG